jgi:dihydrofolate reductase
VVAIIGGTEVFGLFLPLYDAFHLTVAANARIPGGRPVFPEVGAHATPEDVLAQHGMKPGPRRDIDAAAGITLTTWTRPA